MKKLLTAVMTIAVAAPAAMADTADQQILDRLDSLQRQVMEQQAEINSLKARMTEGELSTMVRGEVESAIDARGLAQVREVGPVVVFRPNIEGIEFRGELEIGYLRLRDKARGRWAGESHLRDLLWEYGEEMDDVDWAWVAANWDDIVAEEFIDGKRTSRRSQKFSSFYTLFRLGAIWQTSEGWEVGAGLVTGWSQFQDPRNRRNVWSEWTPFESGALALDYAYAKHSWDIASLTIGQQHNPFKTSFVLWDQDVRPVGVTAQVEFEGAFATLGWYDVLNMGLRNVRDDRDVQMWAGQVGYGMDLETVDFTVAAAYYRTTSNVDALRKPWGPASLSDYKMNTADLFAEVGSTIGEVRLAAQGQVWRNLSARRGTLSQTWNPTLNPKDNDTGFMVGLRGEFADFNAGYSYGRVEADSFPAALVDEFSPVNSKGHRLELGYSLSEHMGINSVYRRLNQVRGDNKADIYQVKFNYLF